MKHASVNFSDEEWAMIEADAEACGIKNPDVLRQLVLRFSDALIEAIGLPGKKK